MNDCGVIGFCGLTCRLSQVPATNDTLQQTVYVFEDAVFGSLAIAHDVLTSVNNNKDLYYKILSLLYEQHILVPNKIIRVLIDDYQKQLLFQSTLFNYRNDQICFTIDELLRLFPENINELHERALLNLYRMHPNYGQHIKELPCYCFFAKDDMELGFILKSMMKKNWISGGISEGSLGTISLRLPFKIEVDGWLVIESQIKKEKSKKIFVAMWFDDTMQEARKQIKNAIRDVGFTPSLIDEKPHNNEISGEILREINNSTFVIADVTGQRQGVYFEAGYAMGQKKQVIFCCRKAELKEIHFDTRQYNHIVWETELDLFKKLRDRLLGTIALKE